MITATSSMASHVGHVRQHMEDRACAFPQSNLYAVIDGTGGQHSGAIISQFIETRLAEFEDVHQALEAPGAVFETLNEGFLEYQREQGTLSGQCASCAMLRLTPHGALISHIGDCRVFVMRHGMLHHITRDHILANEYPELVHDTSTYAHYGHIVTRAIGLKAHEHAATHTLLGLEPGDRFLLCSDGVTQSLEDAQILELMRTSDIHDLTGSVRDAVLDNRAPDNIAIVGVHIEALDTPFPERPLIDFGSLRSTLHASCSWPEIVALCDTYSLTPEQLIYTRDLLDVTSPDAPRPTPDHWLIECVHELRERSELTLCNVLAPAPGMTYSLTEFRHLLTHPDLEHITTWEFGHDTLSLENVRDLSHHPAARRIERLLWDQDVIVRDPRAVTALLDSSMLSPKSLATIKPLTDDELERLARHSQD